MVLEATITCPECSYAKKEIMPAMYSKDNYKCTNCHTVLTPRPNECCVFCSYSNTICPPIQQKRDCCAGDDPNLS